MITYGIANISYGKRHADDQARPDRTRRLQAFKPLLNNTLNLREKLLLNIYFHFKLDQSWHQMIPPGRSCVKFWIEFCSFYNVLECIILQFLVKSEEYVLFTVIACVQRYGYALVLYCTLVLKMMMIYSTEFSSLLLTARCLSPPPLCLSKEVHFIT